jgi:hypothetical protein
MSAMTGVHSAAEPLAAKVESKEENESFHEDAEKDLSRSKTKDLAGMYF